jgi:hypothetical protein
MHPLDFIRPISSITFAGFIWVAETVTPEIPGVPPWVTALGFPVAMLLAVIYALVSTHKALSESQTGRLADRDSFAKSLRDDADKASESRERLIRATDAQTAEFKRLADNLSSRPCQKP